MNRYKLTIEYDGSNYCGFQKQFNIEKKSVEEVLEKAIFELSQEKVKIFASGRTDAGVHATGQVIHFDLNKNLKDYQVLFALNHYLIEEDVVIIDAKIVDENFHARFDAKKRHYSYRIINRIAPLVLEKNRAWHISFELDVEKMQKGADFLIGKHNFSAFKDSDCQAKSPFRTIDEIKVIKNKDEILINISAKSFLHHMVRNIAGTLMLVGKGKITPDEIKLILESKKRINSGPNAPSCGLYLTKIEY